MIFNPSLLRRAIIGAFAACTFFAGCNRGQIEKSPNQAGIMSINACADQLLLTLGDGAQIASLSHYSSDEFSSAFAKLAQKYPRNYRSAEEILKANPKILFASPYERDAVNQTAKAMNIEMVKFDVPNTIAAAQSQITLAGAALRQNARAVALNVQIDQALSQPKLAPIKAIIYFQGGYSAGKNTLIDEVMGRAGFENMAPEYGVKNWGRIDIERLIANPPKMIIIADTISNGAYGERALRHSALRNRALDIKFAHFPNQYAYCGGPILAQMANHLKKIRGEYENP